MGKTGRRGTARAFVTGALVMTSVLAVMAQGATASAAPAQQDGQPKVSYKLDVKLHKKTAKRDVSVNGSGSSGGRTGDIDRAGNDDILAVGHNPADLKVYPNKGYNAGTPTATYSPGVTINHNWGGQVWVGQGKVNGDDHPDVLSIDTAGNLYAHKHSGVFNGTSTLVGSQLISTGWGGINLVFLFDANNDGIDDIMGRKAGTEEFYLYPTTVSNGQIIQGPPEPYAFWTTDSPIIDAGLADITNDGVADWIVRRVDGLVIVFDEVAAQDYLLSYGWAGISAFTISDVNSDGKPDILGRVAVNGDLNAYLGTGAWNPSPDFTVFDSLAAPKVVGYQWNTIRIIT